MKVAVLACMGEDQVYEFICQESESEIRKAILDVECGNTKFVKLNNPVLFGRQMGLVMLTVESFLFIECYTTDLYAGSAKIVEKVKNEHN